MIESFYGRYQKLLVGNNILETVDTQNVKTEGPSTEILQLV